MQEDIKKDLKSIIEELTNNAMFRLSLGSKELFHSNFWAYLLKKYKNLNKVFCENYSGEIKEIQREMNHTDLSFKCDDKLIIVENKIKSKPDLEQIKRYAKNQGKNLDYIVLVSYFKPTFLFDRDEIYPRSANLYEYDGYYDEEKKEKLKFRFKYLSYKDLYNRLLDFKNSDDVYFCDYLKMIKLLNDLSDAVSIKKSGKTFGQIFQDIKDCKEIANEINFYTFIQEICLGNLRDDLMLESEYRNYEPIWTNMIYSSREKKVFLDIMKDVNIKNVICMGITITFDENIHHYLGINNEEKKTRDEIEEELNDMAQEGKELNWFFKDCSGHEKNSKRFKGFDMTKVDNRLWLYKYTQESLNEKKYDDIKKYIIEKIKLIKQNANNTN